MLINGKYTHHYTVTAADMNSDYRLTPGAVLLYVQDCWARFMAVHHLAAFDIVKQGKIWVISEFHVCFMSVETFWSDELEVSVWNSECSTARLYSDFCIRNAEKDVVLAKGYACWNVLDSDTKRIERINLLPGLPALVLEMTLGSHRWVRDNRSGERIESVQHVVNRLDLDFNGHVNNRSYLNIAMMTAPDDFLRTHAPESLHLQWLHETFMGDTIRCDLHRIEDSSGEYLHCLYSGGTSVATIRSVWSPRTNCREVAESVGRK